MTYAGVTTAAPHCPALNIGVEGHLNATRHAANKIIHIAAELAATTPVLTTPLAFPGDPDQFGRLTWVRENALPPPRPGRAETRLRAAYIALLPGLEVGHTLGWLHSHFHWWLIEKATP